MLVFDIYFSLVLLFNTIPLRVYFLEVFLSFKWLSIIVYLLHTVSLVFLLFFILSCSLFIIMPFAVPVFCFSLAKDILQAFGKQYGYKRVWQALLYLMKHQQ